MKCPQCNCTDNKVIDSRSTEEVTSIRRRRECLECSKRFTTYESIESAPILVVKSDGTRQPLNLEKIKKGIMISCEKLPIGISQIETAVADIDKQIQNTLAAEISSNEIGEMVMKKLKEMDEIAYIRFACVYRKFADITNLRNFLDSM